MAVFGLKYWAQMRSKYQGIAWKCKIAQRGYTGSSEQMTFSGVPPFRLGNFSTRNNGWRSLRRLAIMKQGRSTSLYSEGTIAVAMLAAQ